MTARVSSGCDASKSSTPSLIVSPSSAAKLYATTPAVRASSALCAGRIVVWEMAAEPAFEVLKSPVYPMHVPA